MGSTCLFRRAYLTQWRDLPHISSFFGSNCLFSQHHRSVDSTAVAVDNIGNEDVGRHTSPIGDHVASELFEGKSSRAKIHTQIRAKSTSQKQLNKDDRATRKPADSPGNAFFPNSPPMRRPGLSFLYRLECNIDPNEIDIGAAHGSGAYRSIANITGGTFKGPELKGTVLPLGGADWATVIEGTHPVYDPRCSYTAKTSDGCYLYIRAHGPYRPGPSVEYARQVANDPSKRPPATVTQDDVEFSHLRIEAGPGKYNWRNGLVCVGVMSCGDDRIIIDAYALTNFEGVRPESVMTKRD